MIGTWDTHYARPRATLTYPDENLVRLIAGVLRDGAMPAAGPVIDLGCGSGRHLRLFDELGITRGIGTDLSHPALITSKTLSGASLVQCRNDALPFRNASCALIAAWGSLHYGTKEDTAAMFQEIRRVLLPGGHLLATLRSSRDTCLRSGRHLGNDTWQTDLPDLSGSLVSFFSHDETVKILSIFRDLRLGMIERSLMGDLGRVVSHWVIHAIA